MILSSLSPLKIFPNPNPNLILSSSSDIAELGNQLKEFKVLEQTRELNEMNEFR